MLVWFTAAIIFFVIEAAIPGLVSLWFGIAAVITMICSPFVKNILYEFYLFIVLSGIIFFLTRKICREWKKNKKDTVDRIRGSIIKVRGMNERGQYDIYLDGKNWIGRCEESLEVGEEAEVIEIEGIKLILKKIKND